MTAVAECGTTATTEVVSYQVLPTTAVHLFWLADVARIGQPELQPLCEHDSYEQRTYPRHLLTPLCRTAVEDCAACWQIHHHAERTAR